MCIEEESSQENHAIDSYAKTQNLSPIQAYFEQFRGDRDLIRIRIVKWNARASMRDGDYRIQYEAVDQFGWCYRAGKPYVMYASWNSWGRDSYEDAKRQAPEHCIFEEA